MKAKRIFSAFLAVVMTVVMFPLSSSAETEGYYTYTVTDGKATITDVDTSISGDVIIPDTLGGCPVTSIGDSAFDSCDSLTSVTIPDSVTSIGEWAFNVCSSLTSVTIPDSVTSIGEWAFNGCSSLTSVTIPDSVTSIVDRAFAYCSGLTSVTIPDSVTSIGDSAFSGCSSLTSVTIPDSVTSIGDSAFAWCDSLTSVTIGNSVTSIGDSAFAWCDSLTSVNIPDSVTSIGASAFYDTALYNDSSNWENDVLYIGNHLIDAKTSISGSYAIKEGTLTIADYAFSVCSSLTSVTIPDSVTSIGDYAFYGCSSLTSVTIPDSVTSIGEWAFNGCSSLTSVTIPDSVTSIGDRAFAYCSGLTSVTIGNSVTSIGEYAFYSCYSLTSVTIPDSVTSIGYKAFSGCDSLMSIAVDENNTAYKSIDGVLFTKDGSVLVIYPAGKTDTSYTIPDSVTRISYEAFASCSGLTSVTIPDSVTSIGDEAFAYCDSLTSVTIPDSVTSIGDEAFYDTALYNDSSNWENGVLYIGNHLIKAKTSISGSYAIKEGTLTIADEAFRNCANLTSVTIPDSVTSIGDEAFSGCSSLTIYCYKNSYAHIYAVNKGIPYKICDHTSTEIVGVVPVSCVIDGYTGDVVCSDCGCIVKAGSTIPAKGHSLVYHEGKAPTCTEIGYAAYETCENCDYTTYVELPATGHTYEDGVCIYCDAIEPVKPGDVNGDNLINTTDASALSRKMAGGTAAIEKGADVNGDGVVTTADLSLLKRRIAGSAI